MNLTTVNGKTIKITAACIRVSENSLIEGGFYFELRVSGILPKCKKSSTLTTMYGINGVYFTTLFSYTDYHMLI
jgi:hypothetical protein